jgi:lysyl-tRNA synthetase class 2
MPSSVIADIDYDTKGRRLVVTFTTGRVYEYFDVPAEVVTAFRIALSKGIFFNARIRDQYRCREIVPPPR